MITVQTDLLEPDNIKSISVDAVLDSDERPRHAGGRPRKLTVKKFLKICAWIQQGKCNTLACKIEGVDYTGFRAHIRNKPWWQKRYAHADQVRDEYLRDIHLSNIVRHSAQNWQASAWLLERRWPEFFALKVINRQINSQELVLDRVTPEQLIEDIRLAREVAGERPQLTDHSDAGSPNGESPDA